MLMLNFKSVFLNIVFLQTVATLSPEWLFQLSSNFQHLLIILISSQCHGIFPYSIIEFDLWPILTNIFSDEFNYEQKILKKCLDRYITKPP